MVEAARSSRVTQTRKPSSLVQNAQIRGLFLIKNASFLWFLHNGLTSASERVIGALFFLRIFYEFILESSTNRLRNTLEKPVLRDLVAVKIFIFFLRRRDVFCSLYGN